MTTSSTLLAAKHILISNILRSPLLFQAISKNAIMTINFCIRTLYHILNRDLQPWFAGVTHHWINIKLRPCTSLNWSRKICPLSRSFSLYPNIYFGRSMDGRTLGRRFTSVYNLYFLYFGNDFRISLIKYL